MRRLLLFIAVAGLFCGTSAKAQSVTQATAPASTSTLVPAYDLAKEVKIQGTIQRIDMAMSTGPMGTHIFIQTAQGVVDAHLGYGPVAKPEYLGVSEGQSVTVVGMRENFGASNVLLARLLQTPTRIFVLRNEHGIPVRALPRNVSSSANSQKGGL
jgi:hypothetical protein